MIVIGENEIQKNTVMLKTILTKEEKELGRCAQNCLKQKKKKMMQ